MPTNNHDAVSRKTIECGRRLVSRSLWKRVVETANKVHYRPPKWCILNDISKT